jgi:hypothetical protein
MKQIRNLSTFAWLITAGLAAGENPVPVRDEALQRKVGELVSRRQPAVLDLPIGWHKISGLDGSQWHILGTHWWVELHPGSRGGLAKLDKNKQYVVHGVPLEQRYGVIDIWAYKITEK